MRLALGMSRRSRCAAVLVLTVLSSATAVLPAAATTNKVVTTHKLIVAVARNLPPAAEKKLAVLVLVTQNGGPAAGAVATVNEPLTIHLANRGLFRVKAEIDAACKGSCAAGYRISGAADHKLKVVPSCHLNGTRFVCSYLKIVKVY